MGSTQLWSLTQFEGKSYEWLQSLTQHCQASCLASRAADSAWISCRPDSGPGCRAATSVQFSMSEFWTGARGRYLIGLALFHPHATARQEIEPKKQLLNPYQKRFCKMDSLPPSSFLTTWKPPKKKEKKKKAEHISSFWQGTHPPSVKPQA